MFKAALLALLLTPAHLYAEVKSYADFSGGLNTRNSGVLLPDNESPALQNVVLDENGGVSRRKGYSKVNTTAIGGGISDVNAVYQLEQSGGNKYCVSFSSTSGYASTDGCATNTVFVSSLTRNNDVNCAAYDDRLYCVNNQYNFSFDGTNDAPVATAPADADFIKVWRDRCFLAGTDTAPSRLYWSNIGTCDTYTTVSDFVDIEADDGDIITGISDQFNLLLVTKRFSSYLIQFDNANPSGRKVINISRTTGAKGHRAIAKFNNRTYFASVGPNGGQPGVYSTDGTLIQEDSLKLRGSIDTLANFFSNVGRETVDTKADWDAGTFDPLAMSSSRDAGFMQSSYTAYSPTLQADWLQGTVINIDSMTIPGSITLSSASWRDNFDDNNFAVGQATWTSACWVNSGDKAGTTCTGTNTMHSTQVNISSGQWAFAWRFKQSVGPINDVCNPIGGTLCLDFRFSQRSNGDFYSARINSSSQFVQAISIIKSVSGTETTLAGTTFSKSDNETASVVVNRSGAGDMYVYIDGVFLSSASDTSISNEPSYVNVIGYETGNTYFQNLDDVYAFQYASSGTWRSPVIDTFISTPIGGPFSSTFTITAGESSVNFRVRQSTSGNDDLWTSRAATSDTLHIPMNRRYQQVEASLYNHPAISTKTPRVDALGITSASTGTWRSPELFLSNSMISWGTFRVTRTVTGSAAAISYDLRIATYAGGAASSGTVTVTPNGTIAHSTGAYVIITSTYSLFSASETAKDDVLALTWNEGIPSKSMTMAVYRGRLHLCGQTIQGMINDTCFVRDAAGAWTRWNGVNARHLNVVAQNFVAGGSSETSAGFIYKLYDTDSDDGGPINAYWESKDHAMDKIQNVKGMDRLYIIGSNDATTLTTTLKADAGMRSQTYSMNLSTGASFKIINQPISSAINGNTFRVRFENTDASKPWSIYGLGFLYRDLGLMQP